MIRERTTCRLCDSAVEEVFTLGRFPVANSFPDKPDSGARRYTLRLMQCMECDHVQTHHVMEGLFTSEYKYETPRTPYLKEAALALKASHPSAKRVLEIGSNNGAYLEALHEAGFWTVGVDPAATHERSITEPFTETTAKNFRMKFDIVVANNVFAHIDDLQDVFRGINHVLAPNGALVFEVQYLPDLLKYGAFDMLYHEHLDYHHAKPLCRFLKAHGLRMVALDNLKTHGGSIRVTARRDLPGAEPELEVDDTPSQHLWGLFHDHIKDVRKKMRGTGKVVAFGASAKASVLINYLGIADKISYCVDDTVKKQGRYIPGTNIEIRPVSALGSEDVLVTTWNYFDIVRKRLPNNKLIHPFQ